MLAGLEVGSLFEEQKVFQVVVWSTPDSRSSITSINNLLIDTPSGGHVRLEDVAHVRISPTPTVIQRDAVSRRIDIGLNANGRDPGAVAADIDHQLATTQLPLEYHAEVIGSYQTAETLHQRMFASGIAAIIGIFLLLQAAFSSWRLAALFTLTLPVSLSGGVLAAFLFRADMTLATLAGFLAVLAVAARAGIALLTRAQALEVEDARRTRATAVVQAAGERLGPILTTAIATMVALVPLIVTGTIPGQEIAQPIAIVVFGGLITATLVTVFLVPAIYAALRAAARAGSRRLHRTCDRPDGGIRMHAPSDSPSASDRGRALRVGVRLLRGGRGGGRWARHGRDDRGLRPVQGRAPGERRQADRARDRPRSRSARSIAPWSSPERSWRLTVEAASRCA